MGVTGHEFSIEITERLNDILFRLSELDVLFWSSDPCHFIHGTLNAPRTSKQVICAVSKQGNERCNDCAATHTYASLDFRMSHLRTLSLTFPLHKAMHSISWRISPRIPRRSRFVHLCMQIILCQPKMTSDILRNPNKVLARCCLPAVSFSFFFP